MGAHGAEEVLIQQHSRFMGEEGAASDGSPFFHGGACHNAIIC